MQEDIKVEGVISMTTNSTKTMFGKPKHDYLSNIISIRSPESATGSVRELNREFFSAKTKAKRLRIARSAQLASNRALATAKRDNVSAREKTEMRKVAEIYDKAAERMFDIYGRMR
jgi:hypothetical protein